MPAISGILSKFLASQNLPIDSSLISGADISSLTSSISACDSINALDDIFSINTILLFKDGNFVKKAFVTSFEIEII